MPSNPIGQLSAPPHALGDIMRLAVLVGAFVVGLSLPALSREPTSLPIGHSLYQPASNVAGPDRRAPVSQSPTMPFAPLIARYKRHLFGQGQGRWQALPCALIDIAQAHYPQIDLTRVRYANNIRTLHGRAITWNYHVFFPWKLDLTQKLDLFVMLHELEHIVQYEVRGGEQAFLREYIQKAIVEARAKGNWRVHGEIDLEQSAQAKAKRVFHAVYDGFQRLRSAPQADVQPSSICHKPG